MYRIFSPGNKVRNELMSFPLIFSTIICIVAFSLSSCEDFSDITQLDHLPAEIEFNTHIRPILSDKCFSCHGPDANARKAALRLDIEEEAKNKKLESGGYAISSGSTRKSKAFQRIISQDLEIQMPPPESNLSLTAAEIATIEKWIKQGAKYEKHWAFQSLKEVEVPVTKNKAWANNSIDQFVLKKLETEGISPNNAADKSTIIRRLTLDITGLPPTIEEIDNFLSDNSENAYEKAVDRLLESDHYGERMAAEWLDVARYADSHGYSTDGSRTMWPWRDWVIKAFNDNMAYDEFVKLQVAGDKYPDATMEEVIATAFFRNQKLNAEGGIVLDEYLMEYAADRTETFSTAFLGLTMQCAKCHDHKYDPISQKEYYQVFSFFNSVNERGMTPNDGNSGPQLLLCNEEEAQIISFIDAQVDSLERLQIKLEENFEIPQAKLPPINLKKGNILSLSFEDAKPSRFIDDYNPNTEYLVEGEIYPAAGQSQNGFKFTAFDFIRANDASLNFDNFDAFSFSFWLKVEEEVKNMPLIMHIGGKNDNYKGYELALINGLPSLRLIHSLPANMISISSQNPVHLKEWEHYAFTYDGSGKAGGIEIYKNGKRVNEIIVLDNLSKSISRGNGSVLIGGSRQYQVDVQGSGSFDEVKIYDRVLSPIEIAVLHDGEKNLGKDFTRDELKSHYLLNENKSIEKVRAQTKVLRTSKKAILDTVPSVMVMDDLEEARPTFVLNRGAYDQPLERVYPGTPSNIFSFNGDLSPDRLGLANWLVDGENPLTARVAVNRFWKLIFNQGIVKTTEDFGSQGALPHHPELLDFLAIKFIESGWDVKALVKLILMSSTYRQSSSVTEEERRYDPENKLLARGPNHRLQAEFIRDLALKASGLLNEQIGGPSVMPYQPDGLWEEITGNSRTLDTYRQDKGNKLYRRSIYTFWRRAAPPPSMSIFDAPSREFCSVNRTETNTPLQALTLLNDPQFVEAARVLAEQAILQEKELANRIALVYKLLSGKEASKEVIEILSKLYNQQAEHFTSQTSLAKKLVQIGAYQKNKNLDVVEVAAMTVVCNTMLSFDETIMKR